MKADVMDTNEGDDTICRDLASQLAVDAQKILTVKQASKKTKKPPSGKT